ncbi:death-associated protein 1 [Chelonus insularis]|uniref:death-associated protein 1 n=1 Tax=Chelonus insularis TaxID=460826 RepID=UPI00158DBB2E|nr:death-associated protein 1 [Chelonus insularis]
MSSEKECHFKAGHPPAVKAGGMRITQHKTAREEREQFKLTKTSTDAKLSTSPPKTVMISGAPTRGNADFPPEAVQHFHEKPVPTHDLRSANSSRPVVIQQPRK